MRITTEERANIKRQLAPKLAKASGRGGTEDGVDIWWQAIDGIIDLVEEILERRNGR